MDSALGGLHFGGVMGGGERRESARKARWCWGRPCSGKTERWGTEQVKHARGGGDDIPETEGEGKITWLGSLSSDTSPPNGAMMAQGTQSPDATDQRRQMLPKGCSQRNSPGLRSKALHPPVLPLPPPCWKRGESPNHFISGSSERLVLLRCNSHAIERTHLKCSTQWLLVSTSRVAMSTINFRALLYPAKKPCTPSSALPSGITFLGLL